MMVAFFIIFVHWIGDFILQTDDQAKGKSTSWKWLLLHTGTYSLFWFIVCFVWMQPILKVEWNFSESILNAACFALITFICHTITDYFTSRLNSRLWKEGKVHEFFVSIGFDQILHYAQLFLTWYYITRYIFVE